MGKVAFRQSDLQRVLRAAKAEGFERPSVDILPDGRIKLLTADDSPQQGALSPLEEWERKRGLRGT